MNEQSTILSDLIDALNEEELIRLEHRLSRADKQLAAIALRHELYLRELAERQAFK